MLKNKLTRMLTAPDKDVNKTSGPNGVLSRLFRQMLLDLNIGPARFGSMLQDYILDARHGVPNNKRDQTSMRGNLTKEFARPQMTWKVFCKALRFLQITKIRFVIEAHHGNKRVTIHSTLVNFGERKEINQFNEALEQSEEREDVPYVQCLEHGKDVTPKAE